MEAKLSDMGEQISALASMMQEYIRLAARPVPPPLVQPLHRPLTVIRTRVLQIHKSHPKRRKGVRRRRLRRELLQSRSSPHLEAHRLPSCKLLLPPNGMRAGKRKQKEGQRSGKEIPTKTKGSPIRVPQDTVSTGKVPGQSPSPSTMTLFVSTKSYAKGEGGGTLSLKDRVPQQAHSPARSWERP